MKKIMIVDDNCLSAEGIEKNIDWKSLDACVVHICYNGKAAIDALKKEAVDIIISDIEMPDLDGISMSKLAIDLHPLIKVILISAYDKFEYAKQAIRIGVYDYIEKPLVYSYLTEKIKNASLLIEKESQNMELINKSRPIMIEKFFLDLLHSPGKEAKFHLSAYRDYLHLSLSYSHGAVMVFRVEKEAPQETAPSLSKMQIVLYNLYDTAKDCCRIFDYCYMLREFDGFTCILMQNCSNHRHFLQSIHKTATVVLESLKTETFSLNVGIGNIVSNTWYLSTAYQSALHALEYRFFFPQQNIFDARDALGKNLSLEPFSDSKEDELIRLICQKDMNGLKEWIKDFSSATLKQFQSKNLIFIRTYSLLGRILRFLYELDIDSRDIEEKIIAAYNRPDAFVTNDQFFDWLYEICETSCHKLDSSLQTYHRKLCESVLSYIKENFESNMLCLNDIARFANVSPAYLSALFKKTQKISISDAIASARIDAACHYLDHSALSLKEISEKCGYSNQYYFSTSFKKKKGISPSSYRGE